MTRRPPIPSLFPYTTLFRSFEMRREAGTSVFEGTFRKGKGAGQFTFTANRGYVDAVRALGVPFDLSGKRHRRNRSEEHTSELQSRLHLVCRLLLEKKKNQRE